MAFIVNSILDLDNAVHELHDKMLVMQDTAEDDNFEDAQTQMTEIKDMISGIDNYINQHASKEES